MKVEITVKENVLEINKEYDDFKVGYNGIVTIDDIIQLPICMTSNPYIFKRSIDENELVFGYGENSTFLMELLSRYSHLNVEIYTKAIMSDLNLLIKEDTKLNIILIKPQVEYIYKSIRILIDTIAKMHNRLKKIKNLKEGITFSHTEEHVYRIDKIKIIDK